MRNDSTRQPRPEVNKVCPYCGALHDMDKLHTRFYTCKTTASRDTGNYYRRCGGKRGLTDAAEERKQQEDNGGQLQGAEEGSPRLAAQEDSGGDAEEGGEITIWLMRDNHTFLKLSPDFTEAREQLSKDWDDHPNTPHGMVGVKCKDPKRDREYPSAHARGDWGKFIREVKQLYLKIRKDGL